MQLALELDDLVLEHQLALLQALDLQLIEAAVLGDARDHVGEVGVLLLERLQSSTNGFEIVHARGSPSGRFAQKERRRAGPTPPDRRRPRPRAVGISHLARSVAQWRAS